MSPIDKFQFELIEPPPPPSQLFINITPSGNVSLNQKLRQEITSVTVGLWVNKDGTTILLDPQEQKSFKINKNGSIKAEVFTRELVKRGITLPARFTFDWCEESSIWLGALMKPKKPSNSLSVKNNIKKPRTTGLKDMMP